jgi:hypothetical protein
MPGTRAQGGHPGHLSGASAGPLAFSVLENPGVNPGFSPFFIRKAAEKRR